MSPPPRPSALYDPAAPVRVNAPTETPAGHSLLPLRGLTKRWELRSPRVLEPPAGTLRERVLIARGLADHAEFLAPKLTQLHDPSLIPDLDRAAARILLALKSRERIAIYGDYDVDGITATAILFHLFLALAPDALITTYVPHRDEGYGLNSAAIEQLAGQGCTVIVSVDCGVTAREPALVAKRLGIDLIITDHHNPPATIAELPEAYAVVHPRRPDSTYPFGDLSGAGVAYKLAWRLATLHAGTADAASGTRASPLVRTLLLDLLAFAALGAVADVVPLTGENRVLTRFGMERIRSSPVIGLRALVEASGLDGAAVSTYDIGFKLAPRLNAGGRMAHAQGAVELFTTAGPVRARDIAESLNDANAQRQTVERAIHAQAAEMAQQAGMTTPDHRAIVLADSEGQPWQKGVVGIVCSRLVDQFGRPSILLCRDPGTGHAPDGLLHGSGRSIEGFNLHEALEECRDLLAGFGGHNMAAGLKLRPENLGPFVERFTAVCNAKITPDRLTRSITIDAICAPEDLTLVAAKEIESLAPFGAGNPSVALLLRGVRIDSPPVAMGRTGDHLSLMLRGESGKVIRAVAWKWGKRRESLLAGMTVDAIVHAKINTFNGRQSVEAELLDLHHRPH